MKVDIKPTLAFVSLAKNVCMLFAVVFALTLSSQAHSELNTSAGGWVAGMMSSGSAPFDLLDPSAGDANVRTHDSVAYRVGFTTVNGSDTDARITLRSGSFTLPGSYTGTTLDKVGHFDVIDIPTSCINISPVAVDDPPATGVSGVTADGQALFCAQPSPSNGNNLDFRYQIKGSVPNGATLSAPDISFESQQTTSNNSPQTLNGTIGPEIFYGLPTLEIKAEPRWNLKVEFHRGGTYLPTSGPAGEDGFVFSWSLGVHALGARKGLEALTPAFDIDLDFSDSDFPNAQIVDWDMQNPGYVSANFSDSGSNAHHGCGNWSNQLSVSGNVFDNRYNRPADRGVLGNGNDYEVQNGGECVLISKDNSVKSAILNTTGTDFSLAFWPTKRGSKTTAPNLVNPSNINDSLNEWWVANKSTLIWAPASDITQNTTERYTLSASISGESVTGQANVEPDSYDNTSTVAATRSTSGSMYEIHTPAIWSNPNGLDYAVRDPSISNNVINQIAPNQIFASRLSAYSNSTGSLPAGYVCDRIDNTRLSLFDTRSATYTSGASNVKDPDTGIFVRALAGPTFPIEWELGVGGNNISAAGTWSDYNTVASEYSRPSTSLSGQSDSGCEDTDATWYASIDELLAAEGSDGLKRVSRVRGSYDNFPAGSKVLVYIPQQANAEYTFSGMDNPAGAATGGSFVAGDDTNGSMAVHQMLWQTNEPALFSNGLGKVSDAVKIFQTEYARINKVSTSHTPIGSLVKVGDVANYALTANLSTSGSTHQSNVTIWDVLPSQIRYLTGTSKFGGAPLPDPVCSDNSLPTDLFPGADGVAAGNVATGFKACVWTLNNQQVSKASIGHSSADLPTLEYQASVASDTPSGTQILNSAAVASDNNLLPMPFYAGSDNGFACNANQACSFGTWLLNAQATPGIVLNKQLSGADAALNGSLAYTLSYGAIGQALSNVRIIDVFPHDSDSRIPSSNYSGTLSLSETIHAPLADVSTGTSSDNNFVALYTTNPANLVDTDPHGAGHTISGLGSNSASTTNWCTEAQFSSANCPSDAGDATAIMLLPDGANGASASIIEGSSYRITLNFQSNGNNLDDVYSNNFTADSPSLTARRPSSNTVTSTVTAPDLIVTKTATPDTADAGSDVSFEIVVRNNNSAGTSPIYANPPATIRVVDTLPTELTLVTTNPVATGWDCSATSGQTVDCTYTGSYPLVTGAAVGSPILISATIDAGFADNTWIENIAAVTLSGVTEADTSNNIDDAWVLVQRPVDLSLLKTVDKTTAAQTEAINYSIAVQLEANGGRATAGPVTVTDTLPTGLSISNSADAAGTDWDCSASSAPSNVSCTYNGTYPVEAGTQLGADITVSATVDASAAVAQLINTATVSLSGESITSNNSDTASFNVTEALASVSGQVFYDSDNNGTVEASETGIQSVSLTLCSVAESPCSSGNVLSTTSSDTAGGYQFDNVGLGTFYVVQNQPAGFGSSTDNIATISRVGNAPVTDVDFGETLGQISGFVYADMNHDGTRSNSGENGVGTAIDVLLSGTTIDPITGLDAVVEMRVSADPSSGAYQIEGIPAPKSGTSYTLVQEPGSVTGFSNANTSAGSLNAAGSAVTTEGTADSANSLIVDITFTPDSAPVLAPTIDGKNYNFGELPQAGVSGRIYLDVDSDATNSNGDIGIGDVTVVLCGANESPCSTANTVSTTQSAPDGGYLFNNVPAGSYFVQQLQPASYGSVTNNILAVTRTGDTAVDEVNFGERGAAIAGQVFVDENRSGGRDSDDTIYSQGTALVTLSGTDADGNVVNLTQTVDATGTYLFDNLPAPDSTGYSIALHSASVTDPYYAAAAHSGALSHSDGSPGNQVTVAAFTMSGLSWNVSTAVSTGYVATGVGYDFSVMSGVSVSGLVLRDTNRDGTGNTSSDSNDLPQEGVTISLCSSNNSPCPSSDVLETVNTLPDGSYLFNEVNPGSYWVVESQPATLGNGPGASDIIPLTVGTVAVKNINFLDRAATLSGTVFRDNNADGIHNSEPGLESVTITLSGVDVDGNSIGRTTQTDANGDYLFVDLPAPGAAGYTLSESDEPADVRDGKATPGTTVDALDIDSGTTGTPTDADTLAAVALLPAGAGQDFDFSELPATASVSGSVWRDRDSDRNYSSAENAVPGWLVQLLHIDPIDGGTTVVAEQVTGNDGKYQFSEQTPGDYQIVFRAPATGADGERLVWGTPVNGETGTPVANSNADIGDGIIRRITLRADEEITQQSLPLDPSGVVYDSVERVPVPGAIVTLNGPVGYDPAIHLLGGTALASQTTADTGEYQFLLLASAPAGVYSLTVEPPAGYSAASSTIFPEPGTFTPPNVATELVAMVPSELAPANGAPTTHYTSFNLTPGLSSGVVHNHLPLDPDATPVLFVNKQADRSEVELGDSLKYTVRMHNRGSAAAPALSIEDMLPLGFRYIAGTAKISIGNNEPVVLADPIGAPGPALFFTLPGSLAAGEAIQLSYRARAGVGADRGDGINRATGVTGALRSAEAQARVTVTAGVLGNEACLAGRIFVDCNNNHVQDGEELGIPGVRLYSEDGRYLVSDVEGKYSSCDFTPQTHVLKVDRMTLPRGSRLMTSSNRNVGDANSLFVDLKNGELHRADFIEGSCSSMVLEQVRARRSNGEVLQSQIEANGGASLSQRSNAQGVNRGTVSADQKIVRNRPNQASDNPLADLQDQPQSAQSIQQGAEHQAASTQVGTVDLSWNDHDLSEVQIQLSTDSELADGLSAVEVDVQLFDANGRLLPGRQLVTLIADGGHLWLPGSDSNEHGMRTSDLDPNAPGVQAWAQDGRITLHLLAPDQPKTVKVQAIVGNYHSSEEVEFSPALREWIAVGLVEGIVRLNDKSGLRAADGDNGLFERELQQWQQSFNNDRGNAAARVAFFVKGTVKGKYLLTASYDSEKPGRTRILQDIKPEQLYPVFGDASVKGFEAQSSGKLFVRLSRDKHYLLYGDFQSENGSADLGANNRTLTGARLHLDSDKGLLNIYAANDTLLQKVEELIPNGTSGPYGISGLAVENTERVELLVRDRNLRTQIVERRQLVRLVDYSFDSFSGRLLFKEPVSRTNGDGNPQTIRISYEQDGDGSSNLASGVRAELQVNDWVRIGTSYSYNELDNVSEDQLGELASADLAVAITEWLNVSAELAQSTTLSGDGSGERRGEAAKIEIATGFQSGTWSAVLNAVQSDVDFRNSNASAEAGRGEIALRLKAAISETFAFNAKVQHSTDDNTAAEIDSIYLGLKLRPREGLAVSAGIRHLKDNGRGLINSAEIENNGSVFNGTGLSNAGAGLFNGNETIVGTDDGNALETNTLLLGADWMITDKLSLGVEAENSFAGDDTWRAAATAGWQLNDTQTLQARYETQTGLGSDIDRRQKSRAFVFALTRNFDEDGSQFSELRLRDSINGREAHLAYGIRNGFDLGSGLRGIASVEQVAILDGDGRTATSGALGVSNSAGELWKGTARVEGRRLHDNSATAENDQADSWLANLNIARKVSDSWTALAKFTQLSSDDESQDGDQSQQRVQVGAAYRTVDNNRVAVLAKLEHRRERNSELVTAESRDLWVASVNSSWHPTRTWWLGARLASKDVDESLEGVEDRYRASLAGVRATYDITERMDVGLLGSYRYSPDGHSRDWATGVEMGYSVQSNLWLSLGYNWGGFSDRDLSGSDYTERGWYIRLRYKFDEDLFNGAAPSVNRSRSRSTNSQENAQ